MADYPNYVGYGSILLGFVFLGFIKGNDPWRLSTLLVGLALVLLAAISFGVFTDMNGLFDLLMKTKQIDEATHTQATKVAGVWIFVFPAIIGAIGANLIAGWFLSKKPSQ